jgi:hypothetical protein
MFSRDKYTEELTKLAKPDSELFHTGIEMFESCADPVMSDEDALTAINTITALVQSAMTLEQQHSEKYYDLSVFGYKHQHYSLQDAFTGVSEPSRTIDARHLFAAAKSYCDNPNIQSAKIEWMLLDGLLYIETLHLLRFIVMGDQELKIDYRRPILSGTVKWIGLMIVEAAKIGFLALILHSITQDVVATTLGVIMLRSTSNIIKSGSFQSKLKTEKVRLGEEMLSAYDLLKDSDFNTGQLLRAISRIEQHGGRFSHLVFHILDKRIRLQALP